MREAWIITRRAAGQLWEHLYLLFLANVLWFGMQLLVLPGPPATLALFALAHQLAREGDASLADFFRALWRQAGRGWLWALVGGAGVFILGADVVLTGRLLAGSPVRTVAQGFFATLLFLWLTLLLLAIPLSFEQKRPAVLLALRNACVMFARNGPFGATIFAVALVVALASTFLVGPWFFVSMSFLALLGNCVVLERLETHRAQEREADEP